MRWMFGLAVLTAFLGGCILHDVPPERKPAEPPMSKDEALTLVRAGLSEPVLLDLADHRGVEPLDADTLASLKKAGATDPVLQKMIAAERKAPPMVVVDAPYYYYYPYYPYAYPYPYSYVGVGFGYYGYYGHYGHHHHYHGVRGAPGVRIYR